MPTIRVQDWTKEQLEEIKAEEEHTSMDSVIKSLIKERQSTSDQ
jgi:predicted CopG family antitoxin